MPSKDKPRILIVRLGPIGDTILTLPLACAIRRHYPDAYIGWVAEKQSSALLRQHDALDVLVELDQDWNRSLRSIQRWRSELRKHAFRIAIDCQGIFRSSLLARLSGARKRIGLSQPHSSFSSRLLNNQIVPPVFPHVVDRTLELLSPLDIHSPRVQWRVPLNVQSRSWAIGWRRSLRCESIAVLNPGGTLPSKLWSADRFAATARYLRDRYRHSSVVVWRTPDERAMGEQIVDGAEGAAVMAPVTDLHHLGALIERADLFISGDTGPLHLAVAVGTPTIGLYGATKHCVSGPYGQYAIQKAYRNDSSDENHAMLMIGVEHVCKVIDQLMKSVAAQKKGAA